MKKYIWAVICFIVCHVLSAKAQYAGSYPMPDGSGTLRLGITGNGQDRWLKTNDTLMKESLIIRHILLKDTQGFILEVTNHSLPDSIRLVWALGGFDSPTPSTDIAPETCRDNIFNIEGHQITVYHGKIMHLRVTQAYRTPPVRREPARNADDTFHVWEKDRCASILRYKLYSAGRNRILLPLQTEPTG